LFFFMGSMRTFRSALYDLSEVTVKLRSNCRDYNYLEQFMATKPLIDETEAQTFRLTSTPRLTLRDVSFAYPRQINKLALHGCSLVIEPGEKVAIVGRNGSGKTTIVRLLTKIFAPLEGEVLINQIPTTRFKQDCWLDHILYVTQDSQIPDFKIDEALTGNDPDKVDTGRLMYAAQISGAHDFVKDLPDGYQTQIGEEWPGGVGFSSGQLQRLKLTAAFYRLLDPVVYIALFDEPMAHCDVQTRKRFYRSLHEMKDKTILVIAHDPMYLHHFERVVVIEEGCVLHDLRGREAIEQYRGLITETLSADLVVAEEPRRRDRDEDEFDDDEDEL